MSEWFQVTLGIALAHMIANIKVISNVKALKKNIYHIIFPVKILEIKFRNANSRVVHYSPPHNCLVKPFECRS